MKAITLIMGILASALVLSSCASNTNHEASAAPAAVHHDYKGETR